MWAKVVGDKIDEVHGTPQFYTMDLINWVTSNVFESKTEKNWGTNSSLFACKSRRLVTLKL